VLGIFIYVCHPGASRTSLIKTSGYLMTRIMFRLMSLSPLVQSAEKGAYPEVMCATEGDLDQRALYGPTGRMECVGPVGKGTLAPYAYEKAVMERLWALSEEKTSLSWPLVGERTNPIGRCVCIIPGSIQKLLLPVGAM
jgi:hypothetical protein